MVKTRSMVLEERIASEVQWLKLKYFGDRSLEMAIPVPVPLTYQGLSGEKVVEAEKDFYYKWKFYVFVLIGEERWACLCTLAEDRGKVKMVRTRSQRILHAVEGQLAIKIAKVRERIFGSLGYDAELPMRACQLEGLDTRSREFESSVRGICVGQNSPVEYVFKMGRLSVDEVLTSGRTNESDSRGEGGLEQFLGFPGQLVSYPPGSDAFTEFCKAKGVVGGKWGKCVEFADKQFRGCTVAEGEEYFYLLTDLEAEKRDRGIDESISLEYFDGDIRSDLSEDFLCYLSQLEYELSLPLTNLAKGVVNAIGACPVQMNRNMWEVITICNHLNDRMEREKKMRRITPKDVLQFYGVKNFKASGGSYFCASVTQRCFFDLNSTSRTWNDNIIWVKGAKVAEGRSVSVDDLKEVEERARLAILQGKEDTSQMVVRLVKGIWLGIEEHESELKKAKGGLKKNWARAKTDALKEVKLLKAAHAMAIGLLKVQAKANFDETAEERDKLGHHLMLKGYSQEEVDTIKPDTYAEEEEEEAEVLGVVDGLDGISPQTVLDNQGDDVELPEGGSEKVVREMSLRINDLEFGLARERETSKALLSAQAEFQVELDASGVREDHALMCNREFAEQFDKMKEANENREDQYIKVHFRLEKLNQGHVQRGNTNLRECQHKLDAALIREKVLEGETRAKDLLVKRNDELLKDLPAREELNVEFGVLRAWVVESQAMNLALSA
ncbi:hypothetical protein GIB67_019287 [Kingdonia uniflora]|uniref:Uncharacterized protein n=1 Tax=Kingdonia uniflora TaxID=39325 RepID=A0A7J7N0Q1_9MAGN|nr:hypothetical protein GIB67_019287 [Kingdonia uniflora]